MTKGSGKALVRVKFDASKYAGLLAEALPTVIDTERENRRMLKVVERLMDKGDDLTPEEVALMKLLGQLIQDFERRFYKPESVTPGEVLVELMSANNLKQSDIVHLFGSKGITSEVVSGKREISKANAIALAGFFNVSTDLFLLPSTHRTHSVMRKVANGGHEKPPVLAYVSWGKDPSPSASRGRRLPNPWPPSLVDTLLFCACLGSIAKPVLELIKVWVDDRKGRRVKIKHGDTEIEIQGGMSEKKISRLFSEFRRNVKGFDEDKVKLIFPPDTDRSLVVKPEDSRKSNRK